jgi:AcrR family transcriptional regulator
VQRAINRSLSDRYASAADEVGRIIDATYRVFERTGTFDPRMREILAEAGLSTQAFYRHFASKDELLLVVLDDGRHRLTEHLRRRMDKVEPGLARVQAWIEGVLAQAADTAASARTRPFVMNVFHLMAQYPDECHRSITSLLDLLDDALREADDRGQLERSPSAGDARSIYQLAFGPMEVHVVLGTKPSPTEVTEIVAFAFRAIGARPPC